LANIRRANKQLVEKLGPEKRKNAKLRDEMDIIVAEHRKLKEILDVKMRKIVDLKREVVDLTKYKKKFMD
jgi:hypothetical protein